MPRYRIDDEGYKPEDLADEDVQPDVDTDSGGAEDFDPDPEPQDSEPLTQDEVQKVIDQNFAKWNRRNERQLRKQFGTSNIDEVREIYEAGKAVVERAGVAPSEVVGRLNQQGNQAGFQPTPQQRRSTFGAQPAAGAQNDPAVPNQNVMAEIQQLRELIVGRDQAEARKQEEARAKKEFGRLYEEYEMDIEDFAEDRGLSLDEAASIVLRPHLAEYYENRAQTRKQTARTRRVESSDGAEPGGSSTPVDYRAALGPELVRIAKGQGLTPKQLYEKRKAAGKIEE